MINFFRWMALYFKGGETMLAYFFAQRVINGREEYKDVPDVLKPQLDEILIESGLEHLIDKSEK